MTTIRSIHHRAVAVSHSVMLVVLADPDETEPRVQTFCVGVVLRHVKLDWHTRSPTLIQNLGDHRGTNAPALPVGMDLHTGDFDVVGKTNHPQPCNRMAVVTHQISSAIEARDATAQAESL